MRTIVFISRSSPRALTAKHREKCSIHSNRANGYQKRGSKGVIRDERGRNEGNNRTSIFEAFFALKFLFVKNSQKSAHK